MSGRHDYPPAVRVHGTNCAHMKGQLVIRLTRAEILRDYPNGEPHLSCISPAASEGVIEAVDYPPHPYERSSTFPEDATKALCGYCKGTHGTVAQITLEPGMARNVDSTKFR